MAEQGTNAIAFQQLRPLEGNDFGGMAQEQIRYDQKRKEDEEAAKRAQKALADENNVKGNRAAAKNLEIGASNGYVRFQLLEQLDRNAPEIVDISRKIENNTATSAEIVRLADLKQNMTELVALDNLTKDAATKLIDSGKEFNPYIKADQDKLFFFEKLENQEWRFSGDGIIEILNRDGEWEKHSVRKTTDSLNSLGTYSGAPKFKEYGKDIAGLVLETKDGQQIIDPINTIVKGTQITKSILAKDSLEANSAFGWATQTKDDNGNPLFQTDKQDFKDLDPTELGTLAQLYYEKNALPQVQQVINDLGIAKKNADLANTRATTESKRLKNKQTKKEQEIKIIPANDEQGNLVIPDGDEEQKSAVTKILSNGGKGVILTNAVYTTAKSGRDNGSTREMIGSFIDKNGQLTVMEKKTEKIPIIKAPNANDLITGTDYPVAVGVQRDSNNKITNTGKIQNLVLIGRNGDDLQFAKINGEKEVIKGSEVTTKINDIQPFDTGETREVITTRLLTKDTDIAESAAKTLQLSVKELKDLTVKGVGNLKRADEIAQPTTDKGILD